MAVPEKNDYSSREMRKRRYTSLEQGPGYPELTEGVPLPVVRTGCAWRYIHS